MTAIWGPLGWMTLHSTAFAYPESPTKSEGELMSTWLDMFRDTITCPTCKEHFTAMLTNYRSQFPNMLSSRHEFVLFTFRAHNAVNRRLNKPVFGSVAECIDTLRNNVKARTALDYRVSYINHITRHWRAYQDINGIVALKKIQEMKRIEVEYVGPRDTNFTATIHDDVVLLPQTVMERTDLSAPISPFGLPRRLGGGGFRVTSGGFRLRM